MNSRFEHNINDSFLWKEFRNGKPWALSRIFSDSYDHLYNYGIKFIDNSEIVKDLIQDMFLKLWNHRKKLSQTDNIKPYLLKTLRSLILDYIKLNKKKDNKNEINEEDITDFEYSHEHFIIENEVGSDIHEHLLEAINQLSPRQKEVVYLRYFQGYDYKNISKIMNINIQSARNIMQSAITNLKNSFFSKKK